MACLNPPQPLLTPPTQIPQSTCIKTPQLPGLYLGGYCHDDGDNDDDDDAACVSQPDHPAKPLPAVSERAVARTLEAAGRLAALAGSGSGEGEGEGDGDDYALVMLETFSAFAGRRRRRQRRRQQQQRGVPVVDTDDGDDEETGACRHVGSEEDPRRQLAAATTTAPSPAFLEGSPACQDHLLLHVRVCVGVVVSIQPFVTLLLVGTGNKTLSTGHCPTFTH